MVKLFIGRSTGFFVTKAGKQMRVRKGEIYYLEPRFAKQHPHMFQSVEDAENEQNAKVEQATASPGEKRAVTPPRAKKPAAKKPAVKKPPAKK